MRVVKPKTGNEKLDWIFAHHDDDSVSIAVSAKSGQRALRNKVPISVEKRLPFSFEANGEKMHLMLILKLVCKPDQRSLRTRAGRSLLKKLGF